MLSVEPIIEGEDGVARLRAERLDRVRVPLGKVPEVSRSIVGYLGFPCGSTTVTWQ
jgi:hypothetical protein